MTKWFYLVDGHEIGPVDSVALKHLAVAGRLTPKDKVRRQDMTQWHLAQEVKGLFDSPLSTSTPPPQYNGSAATVTIKQQQPKGAGAGKANGQVTPPQIIVSPPDSNEEDTAARSARFVIYLAAGVLGVFGCVLVGFVVNTMFPANHGPGTPTSNAGQQNKEVAALPTKETGSGSEPIDAQKSQVAASAANASDPKQSSKKDFGSDPLDDRKIKAPASEMNASSLVAKQSSKSDQQEHAPLTPAVSLPHWMDGFNKISSYDYLENGYKGLRFGDSRESVEKRVGKLIDYSGGSGRPGLLRSVSTSDINFYYFENNCLRIIEEVDDVTEPAQRIKSLTRLFGKTLPLDIFRVSKGGSQACDFVDAYFFLPNVICVVRAGSESHEYSLAYAPTSGRTEVRIERYVVVSAMDRKWLLPLAQKHGQNISTALSWLKSHLLTGPNIPMLSTIPDFPNSKRTYTSDMGLLGAYTEGVDKGNRKVLEFHEASPKQLNASSGVGAHEAFLYIGGPNKSSDARIVLRHRGLPGTNYTVVNSFMTHLYVRQCVQIVAEYFPVRGEVNTENDPVTGFEALSWDSGNGIGVVIDRDSVSLTKSGS